jgi:hypothetical protein
MIFISKKPGDLRPERLAQSGNQPPELSFLNPGQTSFFAKGNMKRPSCKKLCPSEMTDDHKSITEWNENRNRE